MEISCAQKVARALVDCADIIPVTPVKDRLVLAQTIEALSRSIDILVKIEKNSPKSHQNIVEND